MIARQIVRECVNSITPYTPGKPIEEVKREFGLTEVIKLASNENCLGPSPKAVKAASKVLDEIHRYPDASSFYLKEALAGFLGVKRGNIVMGNGSDELISIALETFVNEGDEVVIAKPTFLMYEIASKIANAKARIVPAKNMKYDLSAMKQAITARTKLVFIANPDNPLGTYVTEGDIAEFFAGIPDDIIVFLDEAYYEFAKDAPGYPRSLEYLKKPNVIISRTFSKAYGLSGLRVGYAITNTVLAGFMERVREPFNVNLVAQAAALAAIGDTAFLKRTLAHVAREKTYLYAAIRRMGLPCVETATNFILVDTKRDAQTVFRALLQKGVIVRDMKVWGLDTFIRVTIGTRAENRIFLSALEAVTG